MTETLEKSSQKILKASASAISLQGSAAGPLHCDRRGGPMTDRYGQGAAPVSPSQEQDCERDSVTTGICGRSSTGLSASAALTASLANRYRAKTDSSGSILYRITWKTATTPAGRLLPQQRASVPRTLDSDCTGLRTGWRTPAASDGEGGVKEFRKGTNSQYKLRDQAPLAGQTRRTASGEMLTGCCAETINGGRLNPDLSRWLQGYPDMHMFCGVTVIRSVSPRRRRS